ncbi:hypothetical protein AGOR_G00023660 [Albula goreensis]|uniref:Transcription cofactor vestigial-like protein 1 n=1 Tax=Albula goreensis TaxID=1534307 RepID=A0A8T3E1F4_9TELE|nr:hypothetical protein AGOR_G00023660 [Albula goreensis]
MQKLSTGHSTFFRTRCSSAMEEKPGSPVTLKGEEQSQSVLFTYFQGDINSVVDEHFSRALNKATKPKDLSTKSKGNRRNPKAGEKPPLRLTSPFQGAPGQTNNHEEEPSPAPGQWIFSAPSWPDPAFPSSSSGIQLSTVEDPHPSQGVITSPNSQPSSLWSFGPRQSSFGLPAIYPQPMSAEGPVGSDRQFANSFLNLLHSDRPVGGSAMGSPSKQELTPPWSPASGFREPLGPGISLEGVQMPEKKKDLYCVGEPV